MLSAMTTVQGACVSSRAENRSGRFECALNMRVLSKVEIQLIWPISQPCCTYSWNVSAIYNKNNSSSMASRLVGMCYSCISSELQFLFRSDKKNARYRLDYGLDSHELRRSAAQTRHVRIPYTWGSTAWPSTGSQTPVTIALYPH